jgi:hypothetical protein
VVGTLWNVNEKESASLLPTFYQAIAQGKMPILALQDMQVAAIHNTFPEKKASRNWSAYEILVGHGAPVAKVANVPSPETSRRPRGLRRFSLPAGSVSTEPSP